MAEERDQDAKRAATERAEELLSRAGSTVGSFASVLGGHLARVAAYTREEAEDVWAEAQHIRRQDVPIGNSEEREEETESIEATSTARNRAEELGVDLREVEGSGKGGRITVRDVEEEAQNDEV